MGKLFGTDGIRGRANEYPVTPEMALRMGKAIATVFTAKGKGKKRVIIGKDTRLSGYMLETALTSGLISMGMDVYLVGPMPTPAVAHLTKSMIACAGLMITASHNPAEDNGIKIFDGSGYKLPDEMEEKIENLLLSGKDLTPAPSSRMGKAYRIDDAGGRYIEYSKNCVNNFSLEGMRIVLDCANGAAYHLSPLVFKELGCEVIKTNVDPDGLNINDGCGALYAENLAEEVKRYRADCGIAFDGDADRVIFSDAEGNVVDGDCILAMLALDMKKQGTLNNNAVAVTSMSNLGLHLALRAEGIETITTDVGDRYVIEAMREKNLSIGGEPSGHIILHDFGTTGDGTVAALKVLQLIKSTGKTLKQLAQCMQLLPQRLESKLVAKKTPLEDLEILPALQKECEEALHGRGRCVLRYSGTENKIRVLVEADTDELVNEWMKKFLDAVKQELG